LWTVRVETMNPDYLQNLPLAQQGDQEADLGIRPESVRLLSQLVLSRAIELARAGQYSRAEILIEILRHEPCTSKVATELLARIRAQQRRFAEAYELWSVLSEADPLNESYKLALTEVAKRLAPGRGWRRWIARTATRFRAVEIRIDVPGVLQRRIRETLELVFVGPLFEQGKPVLREETKDVLSHVGRELEPHIGKIAIEVVGHTNNTLPAAVHEAPDNAQLGMLRAIAAFSHILTSTRLPATMFLLRSAGEDAPPFPNDNEQDRARNETVTFVVKPPH